MPAVSLFTLESASAGCLEKKFCLCLFFLTFYYMTSTFGYTLIFSFSTKNFKNHQLGNRGRANKNFFRTVPNRKTLEFCLNSPLFKYAPLYSLHLVKLS